MHSCFLRCVLSYVTCRQLGVRPSALPVQTGHEGELQTADHFTGVLGSPLQHLRIPPLRRLAPLPRVVRTQYLPPPGANPLPTDSGLHPAPVPTHSQSSLGGAAWVRPHHRGRGLGALHGSLQSPRVGLSTLISWNEGRSH